MSPVEPHANKIERARAALAEALENADGTGLIDSAAEESKAPIRSRAMRLLDQRARSREELRGRLAENEEWEPRVIESVLDDLEGAKLLNDRAFAQEWVRQRAVRRGKSRRVLDRELQQKGVASHLRAEALEQVSEDDEQEVARSLAEKKASSIRDVPSDRASKDKDLRRVVGVLARRGFAQGMSMDIARSALDERYRAISVGE